MAAKPCGTAADPDAMRSSPSSLKISKEVNFRRASETMDLFRVVGTNINSPEYSNKHGFYNSLLRSYIKVDHIQKGRISCTIVAKPSICNGFGTLHGGAVGSFVEVLATACVRTVVAEDKELFLGEISISYLSGTPLNEEVLANASVVKTGRNLTVVTLEFKLKKTGDLLYITHATFFNMPVASCQFMNI